MRSNVSLMLVFFCSIHSNTEDVQCIHDIPKCDESSNGLSHRFLKPIQNHLETKTVHVAIIQ